MDKVKPPVLAYYFPNWHVDPRNEQWHGKGWTEGGYPEPDTDNGYGHLQAVKHVFKSEE